MGRKNLTETTFSVSRVSGAVAGLGAVLTVASTAGGILPALAGTRWGIGVGPVFLAFGLFGLWRGAEASPRDLLAVGLLTLVGVTAIQLVFIAPTVATQTLSARVTAMEVVRLLPFVIAPAVGAVAVHRSRRWAGVGWLAMVGAFLAFQLSVVWPTRRPWGLAIILFLLAVFIVTVGVLPLFVFGSTVTERNGESDSA
jgi:hypothetical protein